MLGSLNPSGAAPSTVSFAYSGQSCPEPSDDRADDGAHGRRCQREVLGDRFPGGHRDGGRLGLVAVRRHGDGVLAGGEPGRVGAVLAGRQRPRGLAVQRDLGALDRVAGASVGDRALHLAGVADRCGLEQGQGVETPLAEDVVVVGGAAARRSSCCRWRCRRAAPRSRRCRRPGTALPTRAGRWRRRGAVPPSRCRCRRRSVLPGRLDRTFTPGARDVRLDLAVLARRRGRRSRRCCC